MLGSEELRLTAKLDLVSTADGTTLPVETTRGRVPDNEQRSWEPERVQLMAQGMLMREHGFQVDHGVIYFAGSRTRVDVPFTDALENRTRLSCHDFVDNQVRLQLFALAYNLGNFQRRLALPRSVQHWSLTTLWKKLVKIEAKVVTHARYVVFQMAEVVVPKQLLRAILERIRRLRLPETVPG